MALAKGFRFKVALMEEHFNENYIESDKFPKITFKGIIENFKFDELTTTEKSYKINGTMELHGKTKEIVINSKIKKVNNITYINSSFSVNVKLCENFVKLCGIAITQKTQRRHNCKAYH
jgi:hypothetical protein